MRGACGGGVERGVKPARLVPVPLILRVRQVEAELNGFRLLEAHSLSRWRSYTLKYMLWAQIFI